MLRKSVFILFIFMLGLREVFASSILECLLKQVAPKLAGAQFLHQKDPHLHHSFKVEAAKSKLRSVMKKLPEDDPSYPGLKIAHWLDTLEQIHDRAIANDAILSKWRDHYHQTHVIAEEDIPESFYRAQQRLAREQGHGDLNLSAELREQLAHTAISDQQSSLNLWLAHLLSKDTKHYPMWAKYWAFEGMTKLGKLDLGHWKFRERSRGQMTPFAELNPEALALVMDVIQHQVERQPFQAYHDPALVALAPTGNFAKLYAQALKLVRQKTMDLSQVEGTWVKYAQGSSAMALTRGLRSKGTGWCSAEPATAKFQLQAGDFYVYYSKDKTGAATQPRLAIRMEGDEIAEVRGIAQDQNLDVEIIKSDILETKLKEFGDISERYQKKSADMKLLTQIEHKHKQRQNLSAEDIRFLYQLDKKIEGFGLEKDPRIKQIIGQRNKRADLSFAFGVRESELSFNAKEALRGGIKYHIGNLKLEHMPPGQKIVLPEQVLGNLRLAQTRQLNQNIVMPKSVQGNVELPQVESMDNVALPEFIGGDLKLNRVQWASQVKLPSELGGSLHMDRIETLKGVEQLPKRVGGDLSLNSVSDFVHHQLPEVIGGSIRLNSMTSATGLRFPKILLGHLELRSLSDAEGLKLPENILGNLDLRGLLSAQYLKLSKLTLGGDLNLSSLRSAQYLRLPDFLGGSLNLSSLISANGLVLSKNIIGDLNLNGLESAAGLEWPEAIGGGLQLNGLKSAKGLVFTGSVENFIELTGLESLQDLKLPADFEGTLYINDTVSVPEALAASFQGQIKRVHRK